MTDENFLRYIDQLLEASRLIAERKERRSKQRLAEVREPRAPPTFAEFVDKQNQPWLEIRAKELKLCPACRLKIKQEGMRFEC